MKKLVFLFLFIISFQVGHSQKSQPYLWEITGGDIKESSYLFGSMHLNDSRLFNFSDSMFYALSSSKYFAAEMDFDLMDTLMGDIINELINEQKETADEDTQEDEEGNEELSTSPLGEIDVNGKATVMDPYLYTIAKQLGLESHGLEDFGDYTEFSEAIFESDEQELTYGSVEYEQWIAYYLSNDLNHLGGVMTRDEMDTYDMLNRNVIQAESFEKLALRDRTFAVVGLGHLVGEKNVLKLLEEKGYRTRRVKESTYSDKFDKTYDSQKRKKMFTISNDDIGVELKSNIENEIISFPEGGAHLSMDMEAGLMYMTVFNSNTSETKEQLLAKAQELFFTNTSPLEIIEETSNEDFEITKCKLSKDEFPCLVTIRTSEEMAVIQVIFGYSNKSMKHYSVDEYVNGVKKIEIKDPEMVLQKFEEHKFQYLFPEDIDFVRKEYEQADFEKYGKAYSYYKTFVKSNGSEYLIQLVANPSGITYLSPHLMQISYIERLANRFDATIIDSKLDTIDNRLVRYTKMKGGDLEEIFTKVIISGSCLYLAVQFGGGERDDSFFDALQLLEPELDKSETYSYSDAQFSVLAPREGYFRTTYEDEDSTISYSVNYPESGTVIDLDFKKIGIYDEYDLSDSVFTYENIVDPELVDSFIGYKFIKYKDVCPGYQLEYSSDSTFLLTTEITYYCNNYRTDVIINSPLDLYDSAYLNEIISSVKFDLNPSSRTAFTDRKAMKILKNLSSRDSLVFNAAHEAFDDYPDFNEDELSIILGLLDKKSLDEEKDYNLKYSLIVSLHDYTQPRVIDKIVSHYPKEKNENVRSVILESLARRETTKQNVDGLVKLLSNSTSSELFPTDMYEHFQDSIEMLEIHYDALKALAMKDIAKDQFLELFQYYSASNPTPVFVYNDKPWMEEQVKKEVEKYKKDLLEDSTASPQVFVMDYMLDPIDTTYRNDLYNLLSKQNDIWGKFRVVYNQLADNKVPDSELLKESFNHSFYGYYVLQRYDELEIALPSSIKDNIKRAKALMKNQCYEQYDTDCDSCELIKELGTGEIKFPTMYYMKCKNAEMENFYFGCVGPFDEHGQFDFENDQSAYFSVPKEESKSEELLEQLIEYIHSKEPE